MTPQTVLLTKPINECLVGNGARRVLFINGVKRNIHSNAPRLFQSVLRRVDVSLRLAGIELGEVRR